MGIDIRRFATKVHSEVICCLCHGVFDHPVEIAECGHLFCEECILKWLETPIYDTPICPIDRNEIDIETIRPAPECILNYIGKLSVKCEFAHQGCIVDVPLMEIKRHRRECPLNPAKPIPCTRGCGLSLPPAQMLSHHCDLDLCQDALLWNDIIEAAKLAVKRKRFVQFQAENKNNIVSESCKSLLGGFANWLTSSIGSDSGSEKSLKMEVEKDKNLKRNAFSNPAKLKTSKSVKIAV